MSDVELRDELMTLLVAGHETTASQLAWAFLRLARAPDVAAKLSEEIDRDGEDDYLEATIRESLRSRPVLPNVQPRLVKRPIEIGGWEYPPGCCLVGNAYLVHHDPDLYPDPYRFRPERFLGQEPGTYTWIPFGGGTSPLPRSKLCPARDADRAAGGVRVDRRATRRRRPRAQSAPEHHAQSARRRTGRLGRPGRGPGGRLDAVRRPHGLVSGADGVLSRHPAAPPDRRRRDRRGVQALRRSRRRAAPDRRRDLRPRRPDPGPADRGRQLHPAAGGLARIARRRDPVHGLRRQPGRRRARGQDRVHRR